MQRSCLSAVNVEKNIMGEITKKSWLRYIIARYDWHYFSWALLKILTKSLCLWFEISACAFEVSVVFSIEDFQTSCGAPCTLIINGYQELSLQGKSSWGAKLITHLHVVLISGAIYLLSHIHDGMQLYFCWILSSDVRKFLFSAMVTYNEVPFTFRR